MGAGHAAKACRRRAEALALRARLSRSFWSWNDAARALRKASVARVVGRLDLLARGLAAFRAGVALSRAKRARLVATGLGMLRFARKRIVDVRAASPAAAARPPCLRILTWPKEIA